MEKYIRRENIALLKKRLAGSRTDVQWEVLLKLLAEEEEAKEPRLRPKP
jgi:hypothetical protein